MKRNIILGTVVLLVLMAFAGSAQAATWTVDDNVGTADFMTILEALDAASNGDEIIVAAGTYTDDIWNISNGIPAGYRITKSVTLLGAQAGNDPAGSTAERTGGESILVRTNGLPYSLYTSGITIDGFMIGSSDASTGGKLMIADNADDVTIRNCIIQNTPSASSGHGVYIYPGANNALVEYNTFFNTAWEAIRCDGAALISDNTIKDIPTNKGIYLGATSNAQIINNVITDTYYEGIFASGIAEITNNDISYCYKGIQTRDSATGTIIDGNLIYGSTYEGIQSFVPVTITGNYISGCDHGIQIRDHASGTSIIDNTIYDNLHHGLEIPNYGGEINVTQATITGNTFTNNGWTGIKVGGLVGTDIGIFGNNFIGNVIYGVESTTTTSNVNAINNWWGDDSGPSGEGSGTGDPVSTYVDFDPWTDLSSTTPIPEFPTIALPVMAVLGLMFFFQRRQEK